MVKSNTHTVVVQGQYYKRDGRNKTLQNFEESFELTPEDWPRALSVIQKKLIVARLRDKDPNCAGFRTCYIISGQPPEELLEADPFDEVDQDLDNMAEAEELYSAEVDLDTGELAAPEIPQARAKKVTRKTSAKGRRSKAK